MPKEALLQRQHHNVLSKIKAVSRGAILWRQSHKVSSKGLSREAIPQTAPFWLSHKLRSMKRGHAPMTAPFRLSLKLGSVKRGHTSKTAPSHFKHKAVSETATDRGHTSKPAQRGHTSKPAQTGHTSKPAQRGHTSKPTQRTHLKASAKSEIVLEARLQNSIKSCIRLQRRVGYRNVHWYFIIIT